MGLFGFLKKKSETIELPPEEPEFLKKVDMTAESETAVKEEAEPELALWLSNGTAVTGLNELASALKKMSAADYKEHVNPERNDVAEWVQEILNDNGLARKLRQAKGKLQAAKAVEREIKALKTVKKAAKPARIPTKAAATQLPLKGKQKPKTEELKLPEIPELGEELQSIPLPEASFEEKPQLAAEKQGVFARLFKRKTKGEEQKLPETPIELPKMEDIPETKKEKKGLLGFLFKRKESRAKEDKQKAETTEAATEIDAAIAAAAGAPATLEPAQSFPAPEFEPEPHHAKWEEMPATAEFPDEAITDYTEELEQVRPAARQTRGKAKGRARQHEEHDDTELIRHDHEIERAESELSKQEEELNNRRLELTRRRYELIKQKGDLEKKKFEEFIRKHRNRNEKEESIVNEQLYMQESAFGGPDFGGRSNEPRSRLKGMPDFRLSSAYGKERLEELLEEAKQHIRQNNVEEAQRALSEVQSVFDTVYMTNNEKKEIEYEILEVEADLKLASLK